MVVTTDKYKLTRCTPFALKVRRVYFLCNRKLRSYYTKRSAGMRTAAYNVDVASIVVHLQSKCTARSIAEEQNQAYAKFDRKYII